MKKFSLLFFAVLLAFSVHAGQVLQLTNPQTGETKVFKPGSFLVFRVLSDSSIHDGFLRRVSDSVLTIADGRFVMHVHFSQIQVLAGNTRGRIIAGDVINTVGNGLIIAGDITLRTGLEFAATGDKLGWAICGPVLLGGACMWGLGFVFDVFSYPFELGMKPENLEGYTASLSSNSPSSKKEKKRSPGGRDDVYGE